MKKKSGTEIFLINWKFYVLIKIILRSHKFQKFWKFQKVWKISNFQIIFVGLNQYLRGFNEFLGVFTRRLDKFHIKINFQGFFVWFFLCVFGWLLLILWCFSTFLFWNWSNFSFILSMRYKIVQKWYKYTHKLH